MKFSEKEQVAQYISDSEASSELMPLGDEERCRKRNDRTNDDKGDLGHSYTKKQRLLLKKHEDVTNLVEGFQLILKGLLQFERHQKAASTDISLCEEEAERSNTILRTIHETPLLSKPPNVHANATVEINDSYDGIVKIVEWRWNQQFFVAYRTNDITAGGGIIFVHRGLGAEDNCSDGDNTDIEEEDFVYPDQGKDEESLLAHPTDFDMVINDPTRQDKPGHNKWHSLRKTLIANGNTPSKESTLRLVDEFLSSFADVTPAVLTRVVEDGRCQYQRASLQDIIHHVVASDAVAVDSHERCEANRHELHSGKQSLYNVVSRCLIMCKGLKAVDPNCHTKANAFQKRWEVLLPYLHEVYIPDEGSIDRDSARDEIQWILPSVQQSWDELWNNFLAYANKVGKSN